MPKTYSLIIMRMVLLFIMTIGLLGCSILSTNEKRDGYFASHKFKAIGQNERVRFLIIHYTVLDEEQSLKVLTEDDVSAHYLIPQKPEIKNGRPIIFQLVDENNRAWHAGASSWNGRNNLNDTSIGVEIVNPGYRDERLGYRLLYPFNEAQVIAIAALAKDIIHRYQISPDNVLGHSDIAPLRKEDPGKLFPWERLATMGIGAWPDKETVAKYLDGRSPYAPSDVQLIQTLLKQYGYDQIPQHGMMDEETRKTIGAFQMHFRPTYTNGNADAETEAIASALVEKYR